MVEIISVYGYAATIWILTSVRPAFLLLVNSKLTGYATVAHPHSVPTHSSPLRLPRNRNLPLLPRAQPLPRHRLLSKRLGETPHRRRRRTPSWRINGIVVRVHGGRRRHFQRWDWGKWDGRNGAACCAGSGNEVVVDSRYS